MVELIVCAVVLAYTTALAMAIRQERREKREWNERLRVCPECHTKGMIANVQGRWIDDNEYMSHGDPSIFVRDTERCGCGRCQWIWDEDSFCKTCENHMRDIVDDDFNYRKYGEAQ